MLGQKLTLSVFICYKGNVVKKVFMGYLRLYNLYYCM